MNAILYVTLGIIAGIFGGMFGLGGGMILVPALVFLFGLTQHQAQGTNLLVMLPPIGLLAALRYWQAGNVKLPMAAWLALGFFLGGFIGASLAHQVPEPALRKLFGVCLLIMSVKMIFFK